MATRKNQFIPSIVFHPGRTLAEKLEEMGMGVKEFALRSTKPEKTIIAVIKGDSSITPDMAVAFESVTRIPAHFWMNEQRSYDEFIAHEKRAAFITESIYWANLFPLADMIRKGWLPAYKKAEEKVASLFTFFGVSSPKAWEDYYLNQQLKVAFRISLAGTKEAYAISAWLREGELQTALQQPKAIFSDKKLRDLLPAMKSLMATQPEGFFQSLQKLCAEAGIKLLYIPQLPKAPISGATRWINETPLIQLTNRYKRNDIFWFSFFHEIGHILLHGKKDIFLEDIEYTDKQMEKEREADNFAERMLLTKSETNEILGLKEYSETAIKFYAKKFNTHPAIIVGKLQHLKVLQYWEYKEFIEKIDLN